MGSCFLVALSRSLSPYFSVHFSDRISVQIVIGPSIKFLLFYFRLECKWYRAGGAVREKKQQKACNRQKIVYQAPIDNGSATTNTPAILGRV